jgi:hypothetical protein
MKIELISGDFQVACDASARQAIAYAFVIAENGVSC